MCKENERVDEEIEQIKAINKMRKKYGKEFNKLYKKMLKQLYLSRIIKNEKYLIMFNLFMEFISFWLGTLISTVSIVTLFLIVQHRTDKIGMFFFSCLVLTVLSIGIAIIYIITKYKDYGQKKEEE